MSEKSDSKHAERKVKSILTEWILNLRKLATYKKWPNLIILTYPKLYAKMYQKLTTCKKRAGLIIPLALLFLLASVSLAQQTFQEEVASSGTIRTIGVTLFWENACTNQVTSVSWGTITPGVLVDKYVYVRNDGTTTAMLSMSCNNWVPATAASYMVFSWNCSNYALLRSAITCAKLTLTVQPDIIGVADFSFMILVQAAG
jgi:hypothetical protein